MPILCSPSFSSVVLGDPKNRTQCLMHARQVLYPWATPPVQVSHREALGRISSSLWCLFGSAQESSDASGSWAWKLHPHKSGPDTHALVTCDGKAKFHSSLLLPVTFATVQYGLELRTGFYFYSMLKNILGTYSAALAKQRPCHYGWLKSQWSRCDSTLPLSWLCTPRTCLVSVCQSTDTLPFIWNSVSLCFQW